MSTFRGEPKGEVKINKAYKPDWRLVPRHEEEIFRTYAGEVEERPVIPKEMHLPPLLEYLEMTAAERSGNSMTERPKIPVLINYGKNNRAITEDEQQLLEGKL